MTIGDKMVKMCRWRNKLGEEEQKEIKKNCKIALALGGYS